jgi:hypothetical protein
MSDTTIEDIVDEQEETADLIFIEAESHLITLAAQQLNEQQRGVFVEMNSRGLIKPIILAKCLGIKPQVIYSYLRNNKADGTPRLESVISDSGQKVIPWSAAVGFVASRMSREAAKQEQIERELRGEGDV